LSFSTLKSGAPALAYPSKWHRVVTLTVEELGEIAAGIESWLERADIGIAPANATT
jgi:hypothetical protein